MTETTNTPAKYDANAFRDRVEAKIKEEFVALMPDEMFRDMVEQTIEKFSKPRTVSDGYNHTKTVPSEFERIVLSVYEERLREVVKTMLGGSEWSGHWDGRQQAAGEAVKKVIIENADEMLASLIGAVAQRVVSDMATRGF